MKTVISITVGILMGLSIKCQDPVNWSFSVKKITDNTYEIHLTPTVQKPWHIYSQTSSDGGALPTKIIFNRNPLVTVEGKTKEVGKVVSKYEEVFDVSVKYFVGKVDFVQIVQLKNKVKTILKGRVKFMLCNDEQCLPPTTVEFSVRLE